ncbi:MAG: PBP1b-binding outer membrane lipoprotein LpoB [Planctomycetota bacterium]|jgi:PBP1b-binding outer membrane lipoprotein LpoB
MNRLNEMRQSALTYLALLAVGCLSACQSIEGEPSPQVEVEPAHAAPASSPERQALVLAITRQESMLKCTWVPGSKRAVRCERDLEFLRGRLCELDKQALSLR